MNSHHGDDHHRHISDSGEILFERFAESKDELTAEITVTTSLPGGPRLIGPVKLNLLSDISIVRIANKCKERAAGNDWYAELSEAARRSVEHWRGGEPLRVLDPTINPQRRWLLEPFIEDGGITVIYAQGGSGKGWLGLSLALAIATGKPILGTTPETVGPVGYLDWEASYEDTSARIGRIARPFGITNPPILYGREHAALASTAPSQAKRLAEAGCVAVIIDSKGMASAGAPESAEMTLALMRGIRRIGLPTILIDHLAKTDIRDNKAPMAFGSVYTTNAARSTWLIRSVQTDDELRLWCENTKANNGPRQKPVGVNYLFGGKDVSITLSQTNPFPTTRDTETTPLDSIAEYLLDHSPATLSEIHRATGLPLSTLHRHLNQNPDLFTQKGKQWATRNNDLPIPF